MGYGEYLLNSNTRAYYKLENTNDSSSNAFNLTNNNSVAFSRGKFTLAADLGTTQANNLALSYGSNIMSSTTFAAQTIGFWVKLRTEITSGSYRFFELNSNLSGTGAQTYLDYEYNGGTRRLSAVIALNSVAPVATYNLTMGTSVGYFLTCVKSGTTTMTLYVNGAQVATNTGSGSDASPGSGTYVFALGNDRIGTGGAPAFIDDFWVEQRAWSTAEIKAYYKNALGRNVPHTN